MRTAFAPALIVLYGIVPAAAQEHLEPERGLWANASNYEHERTAKFRSKIVEIFAQDVKFRAIVLPSFAESFAVGLRETEFGGHEAIVLIEPRLLFTAHERAEFHSHPGTNLRPLTEAETPTQRKLAKSKVAAEADLGPPFEVPIERHTRPLPRDMVRKIRAIWRDMLVKTRNPREFRLGADGTEYHFSGFFANRGVMVGRIWSPEPNSKTWRFTKLAESLAAYASGKENLETLSRAIADCEY